MNSILNIFASSSVACFFLLILSSRSIFLLDICRQQQQLERVKKWLQLRNRDIDHRAQVEERRRKREEEIKVIFC